MKFNKPGDMYNALNTRGSITYSRSAPQMRASQLGNSGFGGVNSIKAKKRHKNWIAGAIKHPGALHRELGVKQGEKIPTKKLAAAAKKSGKVGRRARLAETLKSFHHKHYKKVNDHDADDMKKKAMKCKKKHKHTSACK